MRLERLGGFAASKLHSVLITALPLYRRDIDREVAYEFSAINEPLIFAHFGILLELQQKLMMYTLTEDISQSLLESVPVSQEELSRHLKSGIN
jgi:hypothetical protein